MPVCTPNLSHSPGVPGPVELPGCAMRRVGECKHYLEDLQAGCMGTVHSPVTGVNIKADSTFSRGNGAERMWCSGQKRWSSGGAGSAEREGRWPGRITAHLDLGERE